MRKIADIAKLFDVKTETVKKWCFHFREHLSESATVKGRPRLFTDSDVSILAVIYYYWDDNDNPDYEHVHACLNSREQDCEKFYEFGRLHSSIFKDACECDYEGEEAWRHGILLAHDGPILSQLHVARSYRTAADTLVSAIRDSNEPINVSYPAFFAYRHALELYLKMICEYDPEADKEGHSLSRLVQKIEKKYGEKLPSWMGERLEEVHSLDPGSMSFRYIDKSSGDLTEKFELWVELGHLQFVMHRLLEVFEHIILKLDIRC